DRMAVAANVYVAPFATFDATAGFIKVGQGSSVLDNAVLVANPARQAGTVGITIGDKVVVSFGTFVLGPSTLGATGDAAKNTIIGSAMIAPGSYVSALAHVGPGVTVPSGFRVLPGALVTTNAQASDPALGKVVKITDADKSFVSDLQKNNVALASGYAMLYQGN